MNPDRDIHKMIDNIDSLPPIPSIAQKILGLKINTDEGEQELFKLIETDPVLMSKIIGLSNSPIYGTARKILNLHDAEALIGSNRIKMIALGFAMMSSLSRHTKGLLNLDGIWKHSLAIALTMDILAKHMQKDRQPAEEEVYLAGLLHDIGYLVLNYLDPKLCDQFCARMAAEPDRHVEEIEAEMLEMNHCEMGEAICRHWELPESIITLIRYHHIPKGKADVNDQPLVSLFRLAEKLLPDVNFNETEQVDISNEEWSTLGIDPKLADKIKSKVKMQTEQIGGYAV